MLIQCLWCLIVGALLGARFGVFVLIPFLLMIAVLCLAEAAMGAGLGHSALLWLVLTVCVHAGYWSTAALRLLQPRRAAAPGAQPL